MMKFLWLVLCICLCMNIQAESKHQSIFPKVISFSFKNREIIKLVVSNPTNHSIKVRPNVLTHHYKKSSILINNASIPSKKFLLIANIGKNTAYQSHIACYHIKNKVFIAVKDSTPYAFNPTLIAHCKDQSHLKLTMLAKPILPFTSGIRHIFNNPINKNNVIYIRSLIGNKNILTRCVNK